MTQRNASTTPSIAPGQWLRREPILIGSVRDARLPSAADADRLAERIWSEMNGERAAAWDMLPSTSQARRRTVRLALAALGCASQVPGLTVGEKPGGRSEAAVGGPSDSRCSRSVSR